MANVGRISGPLLKANLERNGLDIAVETDLLYINVNDFRVGVNTNSPDYDLDVSGTSRTTAFLAGQADIDFVSIDNNEIQSTNNNLVLRGQNPGNSVFLNDLAFSGRDITTSGGQDITLTTSSGGSFVVNGRLTVPDASVTDGLLEYGSVTIQGDTDRAEIKTSETDLDLILNSNGTGNVVIDSNTTINANLEVTGNITLGGNLTIGDESTDSITIAADFTSDLTPSASDTYDIGTNAKRWKDGYIGDLRITENSLTTADTNTDIEITPTGTGLTIMDSTTSMRTPLGTTGQRPTLTEPGHMRWNTTESYFEGWDNIEWRPMPFGHFVSRFFFTAIAGQTDFSGQDDTATTFNIKAGTELVTKNGEVLEKNTDYSVTNTTLTLLSPASSGDQINVYSFGIFSVPDVVPQSTGGTFNGGVAVGGNLNVVNNALIQKKLTVNGASTFLNSTTSAFVDRILAIGTDTDGTAVSTDDNQDRGINFKWHDGVSPKNGFFGFDDSTGYFTFVPDAAIVGEVVTGTPGDIQATTFRGNLVSPDVTTDGMTVNGDLTVTGYASFDTTEAMKIPVGTTAERPSTLEAGQVRYNTDTNQFEGYDGTIWQGLDGVVDSDLDTYITAESSSGADNDELEFFVLGTRELLIDSTGLTLNQQLPVDQGGTGVRTFTTNGMLFGNGTGALQVTAASNPGSNATTSYGIMTTDASNVPVWTDTIDGGTY